MEGNRGVDNPLTSLGLALGAPLQLVGPSFACLWNFARCRVTIHEKSLHTYV
jgi:hypothetical protein